MTLGSQRRALPQAHLRQETDQLVLAASILSAVAVGVALPSSPFLTGGLVAVVVLTAVVAQFGMLGLAFVLTATLPWLVTFSEVLPRLTVTFAAGITAVVIAVVAKPRSHGTKVSFFCRLGMLLFFAALLISVARASSDAAVIQAAKLTVFPLMVMVVTEATNRHDLARLSKVALWSATAALTVNLIVGYAGVANYEYYGTGEILGFGSAHTLALLAGCVAAAGLAAPLSPVSASMVAVAAIAAVATGVRTVLLGLALVAIATMISARLRWRAIALVTIAIVVVFASGASNVVQARLQQSEAEGEYQSVSSLGSGRGGIYSIAIREWWTSSPVDWVFGTGLRSIGEILRPHLGVTVVGHSDVIEVGVQLGLAGLIGLILLWWVLIQGARSKLPLLVLGAFAIFNGMLEYSGAVVIGLLLTAGLTRRAVGPDRRGV